MQQLTMLTIGVGLLVVGTVLLIRDGGEHPARSERGPHREPPASAAARRAEPTSSPSSGGGSERGGSDGDVRRPESPSTPAPQGGREPADRDRGERRVALPTPGSRPEPRPSEVPAPQRRLDPSRARDVDRRQDWERVAQDQAPCQDPPSLVGALQRGAGAIFGGVRAQSTRLSPQREIEYGEAIHRALQNASSGGIRLLSDPQVEAYLRDLLDALEPMRLSREIPLRLYYVDMDESNAFVTMGGFVYVTRGLMRNGDLVVDEASLIGVLGHELGHLDMRHGALVAELMEQMGILPGDANTGLSVVNLLSIQRRVYQRELEMEADAYSYVRLNQLGYSNLRVERAWDRIASAEERRRGPQREGLAGQLERELQRGASTHPPSRERSCAYRMMLREQPPPSSQMYRGTANFRDRVSAFRRLD